MKEYIKFPETRQQIKAAAEGFQQRCGMPGIIGAVDGTHVPVPGPTTEHRASFINRKGFPSMILQVICDSNLQFIDIYIQGGQVLSMTLVFFATAQFVIK